MNRQLITKLGYEQIKQELEQLRKLELPQNIQEIAQARVHGDLSENAEFHAANERQAIISSKIKKLEDIIATAEIVYPLPEPKGKIVFGVTVKIYDSTSKQEYIYQLVGQPESDVNNGRISICSPIGQALLGRQEGEKLKIRTPGGLRLLEILEIISSN